MLILGPKMTYKKIIDQKNALSFIYDQDHHQRFSPSQKTNTPQTAFRFSFSLRKVYWIDLENVSKVLNLVPKFSHLPHFGLTR